MILHLKNLAFLGSCCEPKCGTNYKVINAANKQYVENSKHDSFPFKQNKFQLEKCKLENKIDDICVCISGKRGKVRKGIIVRERKGVRRRKHIFHAKKVYLLPFTVWRISLKQGGQTS